MAHYWGIISISAENEWRGSRCALSRHESSVVALCINPYVLNNGIDRREEI